MHPSAWSSSACFYFFFLLFFFPQMHPGDLGGAFQSQWVDPKENFQPRDLLIGGWFPCRFPVIVALVCGARPALLSADTPSVPTALCAFWLKPEYLHCEGWALGRRIGASSWLREEAETPHIWLFCRTVFFIIWDCGRDVIKKKKTPEVAQKFDSLVGARPWRCKGGPQGGKRKGGLWIPL